MKFWLCGALFLAVLGSANSADESITLSPEEQQFIVDTLKGQQAIIDQLLKEREAWKMRTNCA